MCQPCVCSIFLLTYHRNIFWSFSVTHCIPGHQPLQSMQFYLCPADGGAVQRCEIAVRNQHVLLTHMSRRFLQASEHFLQFKPVLTLPRCLHSEKEKRQHAVGVKVKRSFYHRKPRRRRGFRWLAMFLIHCNDRRAVIKGNEHLQQGRISRGLMGKWRPGWGTLLQTGSSLLCLLFSTYQSLIRDNRWPPLW